MKNNIMEIYNIKSIDAIQECEFFVSLDAMAKWLKAKNPIDGKFSVRLEGGKEYDITAANLDAVYKKSKVGGLAPSIIIRQDFFIQIIETEFVYSTVNVIE